MPKILRESRNLKGSLEGTIIEHISSTGESHSFINQDVKTSASPEFANITIDTLATMPTLHTNTIDELTANSGVTISDILLKAGDLIFPNGAEINVDIINESTAGNGVVIDGITLRDSSGITMPNSASNIAKTGDADFTITAANNRDLTLITSGTGVVDIPASLQVDAIAEHNLNSGVTIESALFKDGNITMPGSAILTTDIISEATAAAGITIDGILLRDSSGITMPNSASNISKTGDANLTITAANNRDLTLITSGTGVVDIPASLQVDIISEHSAAAGVTIDGVLLKDGGAVFADGATIEIDTINEATLNAGITIDGALLKDGGAVFADGATIEIDNINEATLNAGVTVEQVLIKAGDITLPNGNTLATDIISESTAGHGVIIDGITIQDTNGITMPATGSNIAKTGDADFTITAANNRNLQLITSGIGIVDIPASLQADTINEHTAAAGVTIDGILLKDGGATFANGASIAVDTINESTVGNGVVIDNVRIQDNTVVVPNAGSDKAVLTTTNLGFYESYPGNANAAIGRSTGLTLGQGSADQDLLLSGARSVIISLDSDNNNSGANFSIYNNGTTEIARITDSGTLNINTINEFTTNNGVVIDGITIQDTSGITMPASGSNISKTGDADFTITAANNRNLTLSTSGTGEVLISGGNLNMNSHYITGVLNPVDDQDVATKNYVDGVAQGLDVKESVRLKTDASLPAYTASGAGIGKTITANANGQIPDIDGVTPALNDRILVDALGTATGADRGIYTVTVVGDAGNPWVLTRAVDADEDSEVTSGLFTFVSEGTQFANLGFILVTADPIVVDTTSISFTQFSGAGQIIAGNALTKTGNQLDVAVDNSTIEISGDELRIASGAAGTGLSGGSGSALSVDASQTQITALGTVTVGTWASSVTVDAISEKTAGAGVTIDGVLLKDTAIQMTNSASSVEIGTIASSHTYYTPDIISMYADNTTPFTRIGRSNGLTYWVDGADPSSYADDIKFEAYGGFIFQADANDNGITRNLVYPMEVWTYNGDSLGTNTRILRLQKTGELNIGSLVATTSVSGVTASFSTSVSANTISEYTTNSGVTVDGVLIKDSQINVDVINEATAGAGVTIDGVLLKDGAFSVSSLGADTISEYTTSAGVSVLNTLKVDNITEYTSSAGTTINDVLLSGGEIQLTAAGSDKAVLGVTDLAWYENIAGNPMAQIGRGTTLTYGQGSTDQDLILNSARSMFFNIDSDNNQTGQQFAFYNNGTTVVASISEAGAISATSVDLTSSLATDSITEHTAAAGVLINKTVHIGTSTNTATRLAIDPSTTKMSLYFNNTEYCAIQRGDQLTAGTGSSADDLLFSSAGAFVLNSDSNANGISQGLSFQLHYQNNATPIFSVNTVGLARIYGGIYTNTITELTGAAGVSIPSTLKTNTISEYTGAAGVSIPSTLKTDTISEYTGAAGVSIPSTLKTDTISEHTGANGVHVTSDFYTDSITEHTAAAGVSIPSTLKTDTISEYTGANGVHVTSDLYTDSITEQTGAAGVSVNSTLKVDTITEATANAGTSVEGVVFKDSRLFSTADTIQDYFVAQYTTVANISYNGTTPVDVTDLTIDFEVGEYICGYNMTILADGTTTYIYARDSGGTIVDSSKSFALSGNSTAVAYQPISHYFKLTVATPTTYKISLHKDSGTTSTAAISMSVVGSLTNPDQTPTFWAKRVTRNPGGASSNLIYSEYTTATDINYNGTTWVDITDLTLTLAPGYYLCGYSLTFNMDTVETDFAMRDSADNEIQESQTAIYNISSTAPTTVQVAKTYILHVTAQKTYKLSFVQASGTTTTAAITMSQGTGQTDPDQVPTFWAYRLVDFINYDNQYSGFYTAGTGINFTGTTPSTVTSISITDPGKYLFGYSITLRAWATPGVIYVRDSGNNYISASQTWEGLGGVGGQSRYHVDKVFYFEVTSGDTYNLQINLDSGSTVAGYDVAYDIPSLWAIRLQNPIDGAGISGGVVQTDTISPLNETSVTINNALIQNKYICRIDGTSLSSQTISSATETTVQLTGPSSSNTAFDLYGTMAGTDQIICRLAGYYRLTGSVYWGSQAGSTGICQVYLNINGSNIAVQRAQYPASTQITTSVSRIIYLDVDDAVELRCYYSASGAATTSINSGHYRFLEAELVSLA